jgi:hypothetical protein
MHHEQDLTAAERLEALAELFARGISRLAMWKMQTHQRDNTSAPHEKRQVARRHGGIRRDR